MIKENLKKYRKLRGLTQKELAEITGVSTGYIQMIELGKKNNPSIDLLHKISDALDVPISEFIEEDDPIRKIENEISRIKSFLYDAHEELRKISDGIDSLVQDMIDNPDDKELENNIKALESKYSSIENSAADEGYRLDYLKKQLTDFLNNTHMKTENGVSQISDKDKDRGRELLDGITSYENEVLIDSLVSIFNKLNNSGKSEAIKRVRELSQLKIYTRDENFSFTVNYDEAD